MQGAPRRQARSSARSFFLLPSVLALLALALFPVVARAECTTASCTTYETEIPHAPESKSSSEKSNASHSSEKGGTSTGNQSSNTPKAHGSGAETGKSNSSGGAGKEETESEEEQKASGGVSSNGGNNNPPTAKGEGGGSKANGGGNSKPEANISNAKEAPTTKGANASKSEGGSSPLVPILIAIAVLAAISIGVVLYRQRKSGEGPDDGRADGRMSSSNAS